MKHTINIVIHTIQSGKEAEKNIEEHFGKCINALAERKAVLLKEASQQVTNQSIVQTSFILSPLSSPRIFCLFSFLFFYLFISFLVNNWLILAYREDG